MYLYYLCFVLMLACLCMYHKQTEHIQGFEMFVYCKYLCSKGSIFPIQVRWRLPKMMFKKENSFPYIENTVSSVLFAIRSHIFIELIGRNILFVFANIQCGIAIDIYFSISCLSWSGHLSIQKEYVDNIREREHLAI